MHMSIGIESMVLVREARKATFLALAFSSSLACTSPSTFFWLGQISTHTLNSMMVPSQAPTPMTRMPGSLSVKAATKPEPSPWYMVSSAAAPVSQVTTAAQRNHSSARGATYLLIAAGPGPSLSAAASASAGTCTKLK